MRLLLLAISFSLALAPSLPQTQKPPSKVELITLGTGTPAPDPERWGPSNAVVVADRLFLIDAGAGVTRRLAAAGFPRVKDIEATFITHLHSDHTLGYPDEIFTTWIMGRQKPLLVYGPPGLRHMTDAILEAWKDDIEVRVKGLERETREFLRVDAREIQPGIVYDNAGVVVTAFPVVHGPWQAFGFRFDTPQRSITLSGDTSPSRSLVAAAKGTDILVHEAHNYARVQREGRPGGEFWPQYMETFHTSDLELGRMAAEIKPKLLVVTHASRGAGGTDDELIAHIRQGGFTGQVVIAKDLQRF